MRHEWIGFWHVDGQVLDVFFWLPVSGTEKFIDDKFLAIPAMHDNVDRARYTLAIVIALLERPVAENEPTLRDVLLSLKKFATEGQLDEMKVILGWLLDTRCIRIALPPEKVIAWKSTIQRHPR